MKVTNKEKMSVWKRKWLKEHAVTMIISAFLWVLLLIYGITAQNNGILICGSVLCFATYLILYNRMMAYVEKQL